MRISIEAAYLEGYSAGEQDSNYSMFNPNDSYDASEAKKTADKINQ